jgi:sugar/nucleoside kinase (ribokinase family)
MSETPTNAMMASPDPDPMEAPAESRTPAVRFAVLGDAFLDISVGPLDAVPTAGADVEVDQVAQHPGGSALNTAWHLAAQGVYTSLYAAVGRDRAAKTLLDALASDSRIALPAKTVSVLHYQPTATCVAMHGPGMDRTFMSAPGAAKTATLAQLLPKGVEETLKDVTHVHVGGFYACAGVHGGLAGLVAKLRTRNVKVSMDPNFDPLGEWRAPAMKRALRGDSAVDLFMPSEVEACEITGRDTAEEALEALVGDDRSTSDRPVGLAVIKRGALGVLAGDSEGRRWSAPACTVSRVVDTNGAGDAFNAGFLRVWASGGDVGDALRAGCAAAAIAAQHVGAVGDWAPSAASVDAQADAEYGEKQWWQKGILACMAPRKLA